MKRLATIFLSLIFASSATLEIEPPIHHPEIAHDQIKSLQNQINTSIQNSEHALAYDQCQILIDSLKTQMSYQHISTYLGYQSQIGAFMGDTRKEVIPLIKQIDILLAFGENGEIVSALLDHIKQHVNHPDLNPREQRRIASLNAEYYLSLKEFSQAEKYARLAISKLDPIKEEEINNWLVDRNKLAQILRANNQIPEAMILLMENEKITSEKEVSKDIEWYLLTQMGHVLKTIGDSDKAVSYFQKARVIAVDAKLNNRIRQCDLFLSEFSGVDESYLDSKKKFKDVISGISNSPFKSYLSRAYLNLAELEGNNGQLDLSRAAIDSAEVHLSNTHYAGTLIRYKRIRTEDLMNKQNFHKAFKYLSTLPENDYKTQQLIARYYSEIGQPYESINALKKFIALKDSTTTSNEKLRVFRLESEYNRKQQNLEIDFLSDNNQQLSKALGDRNKALYVSFFFLILLAVASYILSRLYRTNKADKKNLSFKNEALSKALDQNKLLVKEIHHRVKNNLQVISSLLSMQERTIEEGPTKDAIKMSKSRVESISILHQKLYQDEHLKSIELDQYIKKLGTHIFNTHNIDDRIQFEMDVDPISMDIDSILPIGLISNELICNAIKHAFPDNKKGIIKLIFKEREDHIFFSVQDNGVGLKSNTLPNKEGSLGARMIKLFIQKLEGTMEIQNNNGLQYLIKLSKDNFKEN